MPSAPPYKAIGINGRYYLQGKPCFILDTPYNLRQGDRITQIGSTASLPNYKVDEFVEPVTYAGVIVIAQQRYIAFKIGMATVKSLELSGKLQPLYIIYSPYSIDLVVGYDTKSERGIPFKAVFKKEDEAEKETESRKAPEEI